MTCLALAGKCGGFGASGFLDGELRLESAAAGPATGIVQQADQSEHAQPVPTGKGPDGGSSGSSCSC